MLILDPLGMHFHAAVVFILGCGLLFKSTRVGCSCICSMVLQLQHHMVKSPTGFPEFHCIFQGVIYKRSEIKMI